MEGSFLIETMVVLPVFVCFMVFLLFYFRVMQVESVVGKALNYTARVMAVNSYSDEEEDGEGSIVNMTEATLMFRLKLKEYECPTEYIQLGANGISLAESEMDEEDIKLSAVYCMKLPVSVFGTKIYTISQNAVSRKWIGDKELGNEDEDEDWVYITPEGKAYHTTSKCPYLDLTITGVSMNELSGKRNKSGAVYKICEKCGKNLKYGQLVYITDYGDRYHASLTCTGLKRTIIMVRLSQTDGRHLCKKCG